MTRMSCGHFMSNEELRARLLHNAVPGAESLAQILSRLPDEGKRPCDTCLILQEANGL